MDSKDPIFDEAPPVETGKDKGKGYVPSPLESAQHGVRRAQDALTAARQAVLDAEAAYGRAVAILVDMERPAIEEADGEESSAQARRRQTARISAVLTATGEQAQMASEGARKARLFKPHPMLPFGRRVE